MVRQICEFPGARIMVVDDDSTNVNLLERLLQRAGYAHTAGTSDPLAAEALYGSFRPNIVLLDLHMPQLDGLSLLARMRAQVTADLVPVLVLTGDPRVETKQRALSSGAKDFIGKPFEAVEILLRIHNLLETHFAQAELRAQNQTLEQKVLERTHELVQAEFATLRLLARAAEFRDDVTGRHTQRVGELSARLAGTLGLDPYAVHLIRLAAPLHDIGKIGVPDSVLLKKGPLTTEERTTMQRHTTIGADILSGNDSSVLLAARDIALSHHERWDGAGYPHGVAGRLIPHPARIVAVADVFDALRHDRPYRAGLELSYVIDEIRGLSGSQLDPEVVEAFDVLAAKGALDEAA